MDKYEIRRLNFAALIESRYGGKKSKMAEATGISPSYVSRMLYPEGKPAKKRIGEDIVELLEMTFSLRKGSLDEVGMGATTAAPRMDADSPFIQSTELPEGMGVRVGEGPLSVTVPAVKFKLRAGVSSFVAEADMNIDHGTFQVPVEVIDELRLNPKDLYIVAVKGRSMEPAMAEDDKVLIDTSKKTPIHGETYALNWNGEPIIKRLLKKGDSWTLFSWNPEPEFHTIDVRSGQCSIIGMVVWQPARVVKGRF